MPTYRPGEGQLEGFAVDLALARPTTGPPVPAAFGDGLIVTLRPIHGVSGPHLETPFVFQASPLGEFGRSSAYTHFDYDTVRAGQRSRRGGRQLEQVSFGTVFVDYNAPWDVIPDLADEFGASVFRVESPLRATKRLRQILWDGKAMLLSAANPRLWDEYDLRMPATMRSLQVTERSGEVDARYVDVSFAEYRDVKLKLEKRPSRRLPATLAVADLPKARDTLHELAKFYYKDPARWKRIRAANPKLHGVSPNKRLRETSAFKKNPKLKVRVPTLPSHSGVPEPDPIPGSGRSASLDGAED